ncbi:MAG TPA: SMP-30/gluconolactonase/LRE family protein [Pyrinomonadaceae bacterium]|nr:SMP-30/gluconolactonase/LRE family protein [Pyrinomonadaceae bacterium]
MNLPQPTRRRLATVALALAFLASVALTPGASANNFGRPFGDARVLATVPSPNAMPEGIAVRGDRVYVSGPATFGTAGNGEPSGVWEFDIKTGALTNYFPAQGENLAADHANSCIAFDGAGRLYVNNIQLGVYRLNTETGAQEIYAPKLPDLPNCNTAAPGTPCSPTLLDIPAGALPNDLAFDAAGNLYVTDSLQATIWRIPAGGGPAQIWFQDARLDSPYIGANGVRVDPTGARLFVSHSLDFAGVGRIYTLPLVEQPAAADLKVFREYAPGDTPDGIAFGRSGNLYVAIAAPFQSGVSILRPDGAESARLKNPLLTPTFPYDSPANIAFNRHGSLLVINHPFATMDPSHFTVLDVYVNDREHSLIRPNVP